MTNLDVRKPGAISRRTALKGGTLAAASSIPISDRNYLGIHQSDERIFFQITLNTGGSTELKQRFYRMLVEQPRNIRLCC